MAAPRGAGEIAAPAQEPSKLGEPRPFGAVNWLGVYTLCKRGLKTSKKDAASTLVGPVISSLLFLAVFALAAGQGRELGEGLTLLQFIGPGMIIFAACHGAFFNASATLIMDKHEGTIQDLLGAPLSPGELLAGFVLASAALALIIALTVLAISWPFADYPVSSWTRVVFLGGAFVLLACFFFSLIGVFVGLWSDRWEQFSAAETFLILPLGFLSCAFFTLESVPAFAQTLILLNPIFYAIDGFRGALTGYHETSFLAAALVLLILNLGLSLLLLKLLARGYKVKP